MMETMNYNNNSTLNESQMDLNNENHQFTEIASVNEYGINIDFIPSKRKKTKKITITISGDFTIINSAYVLNHLNKILQYFDVLNICLKNISSIDLSAIQCLYSIKANSDKSIKTITIESEFTKEYKNLINSVGLLPILNNTLLIA